MVSEQGNLSAEAVRANQSDARAWSPAPSRRTIVVLTRINANPEIIKMNLKVMEMNTAPNGAENPNRALWEKGDFTEIAAFMRQSGEAVVKSLEVTTPLRVLDLGCGDGTTAVPLAPFGGEVVGIDISRNLVDAREKRAAKAGLHR